MYMAEILQIPREENPLKIFVVGKANLMCHERVRAFVKSRTSDHEFSVEFRGLITRSDHSDQLFEYS